MSEFQRTQHSPQRAQQTTLAGWKRNPEEDGSSCDPNKRKQSASGEKIWHGDSQMRWENKSLPNGPMLLLRCTIGGSKPSQRKTSKNELISLPDWNDNVTFQIFGKECRMRRRICQYSSGGNISYSYSGLKKVIAPDFPEVVYRIKSQVENLIIDHLLDESAKCANNKHFIVPREFLSELKTIKESRDTGDNKNEVFNYCLLNHYRHGEEYMGYHADDESSLHPHYPIASVSLGSTRNFDVRLRKKGDDGKRPRLERIPLGDGDLLLMFYPMQEYYEHGIPVEKRVLDDRINLTFRRVRTSTEE